MSLAPEAVQPDRDLERRHPESAAAESPVHDMSLHPLGSVFSALGADGSDGSNVKLASSTLLQRRANGEMRMQVLRRLQQSAGNQKAQQLVMQLRRSALVQRECACGGTCSACQQKGVEEEESQLLQRQVSGAGAAGGVVDAGVIPSDSAGQPLDRGTREFMEPRLGSNFSDVRVHTDTRAAQSSDALAADAYTSGRDIYFAAGKYAPSTREGQHLLAHELTHTVQQENGAMPAAASPVGGVMVGDATDHLETEAERAADAVTEGSSAAKPASHDAASPVRRSFGSFVGGVWDATGGRVVNAAEDAYDTAKEGVVDAATYVYDKAKEGVVAVIDRLAPGLLPLLRNAASYLQDKITGGMDTVFNGISSRVQKQGVAGAITGLLGDIAGSIGKSLGQLVTGTCHSVVEAAGSLIHFIKGIAGDAFTELGKLAGDVGEFFSGLWNDYAAPALDAIKKVAGEAWSWIKDKAQWVWDKLLPIRNAVSSAWNWIKKEFNFAKDEAGGVLDWFYDKAKAAWMKIREQIAPILGPLKMVATALLLLSPLGPIIILWKAAPVLWQALQYIWAHGLKPASEAIRAEFREHILPSIMNGISAITAKLDQASDFLCQHAGTISTGLRSLEGALSKVPFLSLGSKIAGAAAGFFENLSAKGKCKFSDVIAEVKALLHRIYEFVRPVLEMLRQAVLIAEFGPFAIVDDGVWKTLNSFVAFAKKTPCIREIAGLLQIDTVMEKLGEVRHMLKNIIEVISDQKKFEAEIHKALDGLLGNIPSQAWSVLGAFEGLDGRHFSVLEKNYMAPKIAETISKAPSILINVVWSLIWPWPGVIEQSGDIKVQAGKFKQSLWDFNFSKAIDAGLAIWRDVNGIVGLLYGWFYIAAMLIGSAFGAPEAGAAVAYEVGEVLLASTIAAEMMSIDKAKLNLMLPSRLAKPENERADEDKEDYETVSGGLMNLAMMYALSVLGEIAVDFAKGVFAEIKGVFLPEGVEAPKTDIAPKTEGTGKAGEPGEKGTPNEGKPKTEEGQKEIPPEELKAQIEELRQKASDPENVRRPADPASDAEMDADGHEFDRNKEERTWCRHSETICDINVGDDVNAKVDKALEEKAAQPEVKPTDPDVKPTGPEVEPADLEAKPADPEKLPEDPTVDKAQRLEDIKQKLEANEEEVKDLDKKIKAADDRVREAFKKYHDTKDPTEKARWLKNAERNAATRDRLRGDRRKLTSGSDDLRGERAQILGPKTWQDAEDFLRREFGGQKKTIPASDELGKRDIDCFTSDGISREAKFGGPHDLSPRLQNEIAKDVALRNAGKVGSVEWHFYPDPASGFGPTPRLEGALSDAGIKIVLHRF
jgi:phage-related protein